ncbi:hypothetical protein AJ78_00107 [Emergomyces pasteurianus Ep9510]|uniref:Uncharacterized protein n=1 Tax=Emergomyces pasteurianus Ep9510 TaxID=1447872 RepID=A0A1J9PU30_9EURO|nr:hypothetical protein AJ78_00107 [Emergomyces pasteurianus Ep9510]
MKCDRDELFALRSGPRETRLTQSNGPFNHGSPKHYGRVKVDTEQLFCVIRKPSIWIMGITHGLPPVMKSSIGRSSRKDFALNSGLTTVHGRTDPHKGMHRSTKARAGARNVDPRCRDIYESSAATVVFL